MTRQPTRGPPQLPTPEPALKALVAKGRANPFAIRTMRCRTVAQGRFRHVNHVRNLPPQPVVENESGDLSGEDNAPNACEMLLAALGSCLAMGIHANAVARHILVRSLELVLEADVNNTAVWGAGSIEPKPLGFEAVRVSVRMQADASHEVLQALVNHTTLWSPVANTFHNSVHLDVAVDRPKPDGVTA